MAIKNSKKYREDLHVEEAIVGNVYSSNNFLEFLLTERIFQIFYLGVAIVAALFVYRIISLGWFQEEFYKKRAFANVNQEQIIPAPRGIIFDRFQKPLAQNKPVFTVSLKISEYFKNREIAGQIRDILDLSEEDILAALAKADIEKNDSIIIARDINPEEIIKLKEKAIAGLEFHNDFRRFYPYGSAFAHLVGYADIEGSGKTGLELFYDDQLKGNSGINLIQRDANGKVLQEYEMRAAAGGRSITTTIDAEFQEYFYNRLAAGIRALNRKSGAGIAIDTRNGEVLAAVSFPSFDSNLFAKRGTKEENRQKTDLLQSQDKPLFSRFSAGAYSPGSTIKPLVAVAALTENVVVPETSVFSKGYIEIPNPYFPDKPSRFLDWKPHGWVNLYSALARSSNVYFYSIGGGFENIKGLGINKLEEWWRKFGLGAKTGIDFPSENEGFLPNPEEKEKRAGSAWRIGDTYNVSIGQGDLLVTPLQLLNYIAAIANGGKLYQPHLNKEKTPAILNDLSGLQGFIKDVQRGMEDVVYQPYGTAISLRDLPFKVAAKTGTAQIEGNTKINAFFVGYAPAELAGDRPQIAILVLVEDAVEGSANTIPIAKDVLRWYYENRIAND